MTTRSMYDVLIVGAGPVGLATALGLYTRGLTNILVLDQTRGFRQAGQTVDLLPNGLKALKLISAEAYENIKASSDTMANPSQQMLWKRRNLAGKIMSFTSLDFDDLYTQYGEGRVSVPWYNIQTALRSLLPAETIKVNHRCISLKAENNIVSIGCLTDKPIEKNPFAYWETQEEIELSNFPKQIEKIEISFEAKLVIAADGINSTIRQILYEDTPLEKWAKPHYSGYSAIGCFAVENIPDEIVDFFKANYLNEDRLTTITPDINELKSYSDHFSPRMILIQKESNTFGYLLHLPISLEKILNLSRFDLLNFAQKTLTDAGYPKEFSQLLELSRFEPLITRPYYIHPADFVSEKESVWSFGRTVLVGDAAHGMPPFMAQGTNQGFEDALMISQQVANVFHNNQIDEEAEISKIFQRYEKERRPFMSKMQSATMRSHLWTKEEWEHYSETVYQRNFAEN